MKVSVKAVTTTDNTVMGIMTVIGFSRADSHMENWVTSHINEFLMHVKSCSLPSMSEMSVCCTCFYSNHF